MVKPAWTSSRTWSGANEKLKAGPFGEEYKFVELLSLSFDASPEEVLRPKRLQCHVQVVRQQITFRYNSMKGAWAAPGASEKRQDGSP